MPETMDSLTDKIRRWGEERSDIRAILVFGSRARTVMPADEWSDLDLWLVADDPRLFLEKRDWIEEIGRPIAAFYESAATGECPEHRVLFEGFLDVDFSPISASAARQYVSGSLADADASAWRRGIRFLVDKIELWKSLPSRGYGDKAFQPPREDEFLNVVNDFWFHCVWIIKKLKRGEIWVARSCLESYLRHRCLLPVFEWHAKAHRGDAYDVWHDGRFLEHWADPRIVRDCYRISSGCDSASVFKTLTDTMNVFRWVTREIAVKWRYRYPDHTDSSVTGWMQC